MTTKDLAQNFVSQFNKPFDLGTISSLIGRSPRSVKPVLAELLTAKQIKLVDPEQGIYVRDNRYLTSVCYHQKGNWQFKPEAAAALLDHIEKVSYTSVRGVAKDFPRSRQWVFVYMEALASVGILDYEECYVVRTRDNLKEIGKVVKKGALNDLGYRSTPRPRTYEPVHGEDEETHLRRLSEARARLAEFEKFKLKI